MQKKPSLFVTIAITVFLALLTLVGGFLSSVASNELPSAVKPYLQFTWPLLGVVTIALISLTVWQAVRQSATEERAQLPGSQQRQRLLEQQNRRRILTKVRTFWITGVLEQSLHGAALIALGLEHQANAVANPLRLVSFQPDHPAQPLPPGTRILQVYDDAGGELLILGEPGSGKTTLLLELARDLLDRAEIDDSYPMPVVFNLSSWAEKRQSMTEWFVEELNSKYRAPLKIAGSGTNKQDMVDSEE